MGDPTVMIRLRRPGDTADLMECVRQLQDYERAFDPLMTAPEAMDTSYLDGLDADCRKSEGAILVADAGGRVAGYACILARVECQERDEIEYDYALVADLVVRSDWRGQGVGRALLEVAERHARDTGAKTLRIAVLHANRRARQVYEDFGFSPRLVEMEKPL